MDYNLIHKTMKTKLFKCTAIYDCDTDRQESYTEFIYTISRYEAKCIFELNHKDCDFMNIVEL